jgi:6-phospho-beta-glucosidase
MQNGSIISWQIIAWAFSKHNIREDEHVRVDKITVVGGGSTYTPEFVDGFIQHRGRLSVGEIVLYDIDKDRLDLVGGFTSRMVEHAGLESLVTLTTDRPAAVEGANFIVSQIRVGGMTARIRDEKIPLKHGVIGQETTGPGGTLKAWRTIPAVLDIARDVERYAPNAWLLNFTNPSGIITETLLKYTNLRSVGLCNNPINFVAAIAAVFEVSPEEVFLEWVGLNHVNWVRRVFVNGRDVTGAAIERVEVGGIPDYPFDARLVRMLGVLPTWYLQYYYHHDRKIAEALEADKTRGEVVAKVEEDLLKKYADPELVTKPLELGMRGGARYSEAAIRLILSLVFDRRDVQIVDVLNDGAIEDLPGDGSVEVPCVIGAHGISPLHMGQLPDTIRSLCQTAKAWESWVVEAGVTGSRQAALMAMMTNPLVPSFDVAQALLEDMLEENKEFLPQFFA